MLLGQAGKVLRTAVKSGLTGSCTRASPIKSRVYSLTNTLSPKRKSLRVVPPHRFLLMREASCCWTTERRREFAAVRIELTLFWL